MGITIKKYNPTPWAAVVLAAVMALFLSAKAMAADGDLNFEHTAFDFGTVKANSAPVVHEFKFVNASAGPVAVVSASASCGCTKASYSPEPLHPGDEGVVTVTFNPASQRGYVNKVVKVRYKQAGKKMKTLSLKISGNVVPK